MRKILFILFITFLLSSCGGKSTIDEDTLNTWIENTTPYLRAGDLVFRKGIGIAGQTVIIAGGDGEAYSHIGIIVNREGEEGWCVCHAVPGESEIKGDIDRVKCESIESFFSIDKSSHGKIVRVTCNDSIAEKAVDVALQMWKDGVPFDHNYDKNDTTAFYCTQFVAWAYNLHGVDLVEDRCHPARIPGFNGVFIFPSDIEQSSLLTQISNY